MVVRIPLEDAILVRIQAPQQIRTITLKLGSSYKERMGPDRNAQQARAASDRSASDSLILLAKL